MKKESLMTKSTYKGFELFNDIEDQALRTRNRAVVLANMADDHTKNKMISPNGAGLMLGYFSQIPETERKEVQDAFVKNIKERGFAIVA